MRERYKTGELLSSDIVYEDGVFFCTAVDDKAAERIAAALNAQLPVRAVEYGSREHADKLSAEIAELRETLEKANDAYAQGVTAGRSEALNAAGVVEALRPLAEAVERLDNARHGNDFVGTICAQSQIIEAARAALAAVKEKGRG